MNRLTKKDYAGYDIKDRKLKNDYTTDEIFDCIQKLGKYEDIEELCKKIKTQPVYQKIHDGDNDKCIIYEDNFQSSSVLYNFEKRRIEIYEYEFMDMLELDEYGKTWAFSREELENE